MTPKSPQSASRTIRGKLAQCGIPTRWDAAVVIALLLLCPAHYLIPAQVNWVHAVLFWLFQVPVLIGAASRGIRGGLAVAFILTLAFLPHAVGPSRQDGMTTTAIWMHLSSLYVIAVTAGWLRERWRREEVIGERLRELRSLTLLSRALRKDVGASVTALRGITTSLRPMQARAPGLSVAVEAMEHWLGQTETLHGGLEALKIDARVGLVRLDRIFAAMSKHLESVSGGNLRMVLDWQCSPSAIPVSVSTLGSSLATLALSVAPPWGEVRVSISRTLGHFEIDLRPLNATSGMALVPTKVPGTVMEMACQVIRAHGGWIECNSGAPHLRVGIPSSLRVRTLASNHPVESDPAVGIIRWGDETGSPAQTGRAIQRGDPVHVTSGDGMPCVVAKVDAREQDLGRPASKVREIPRNSSASLPVSSLARSGGLTE